MTPKAQAIHDTLQLYIDGLKVMRERALSERSSLAQEETLSEIALGRFSQDMGEKTQHIFSALEQIEKSDLADIRLGLTGLNLNDLIGMLESACMGNPVGERFYAALIMAMEPDCTPDVAMARAHKADEFMERGNPQRLLIHASHSGQRHILAPTLR